MVRLSSRRVSSSSNLSSCCKCQAGQLCCKRFNLQTALWKCGDMPEVAALMKCEYDKRMKGSTQGLSNGMMKGISRTPALAYCNGFQCYVLCVARMEPRLQQRDTMQCIIQFKSNLPNSTAASLGDARMHAVA